MITDRCHLSGRRGACAVFNEPAWCVPFWCCARYRCGVVDRARAREDVRNSLSATEVSPWGCVMVEFVRFTLDDGSEVLFESAESDLVAPRGGQPEVRDGGKLTARLQGVAEAAEEVAGSLRSRLVPDEVSLEFGLKVSSGVNWFFAGAQGEGTISHLEVGGELGVDRPDRNWAGSGDGVTP